MPRRPVADRCGLTSEDSLDGSGRRLLRSRRPYLMRAWHLRCFLRAGTCSSTVLKFGAFHELPGFVASVKEWVNPNPVYGVSMFTAEYYSHIWASVYRVAVAFISAIALGVRDRRADGMETGILRTDLPAPRDCCVPIPILAWIPLAILSAAGTRDCRSSG